MRLSPTQQQSILQVTRQNFGADAKVWLFGSRVDVLNTKGNTYRLIAMINFDYDQLFIRFVANDAEYNGGRRTRNPRNFEFEFDKKRW